MSYDKIKNGKIKKNEKGHYVFNCSYADSSMSDYNGNDIWHDDYDMYSNFEFKTKEALENLLFEEFLNGNLHGSYGKFSILNWDSYNSLELSKDKIQELEDIKKVDYELYRVERIKAYKVEWLKYLASLNKKYIVETSEGYIEKTTSKRFYVSDLKTNAKVFKGNFEDNSYFNKIKNFYPKPIYI